MTKFSEVSQRQKYPLVFLFAYWSTSRETVIFKYLGNMSVKNIVKQILVQVHLTPNSLQVHFDGMQEVFAVKNNPRFSVL